MKALLALHGLNCKTFERPRIMRSLALSKLLGGNNATWSKLPCGSINNTRPFAAAIAAPLRIPIVKAIPTLMMI